ncbi:MAG: DUF2382 domain-containing protein [Deltaproteobacteria bacterium]|nr:DUF2382 domain-containing protein [Deltaproteobacteria bacterium]
MPDADNRERGAKATKVSVPIVEEQIEVGSREVVAGRAVINKHVEEREELVDLPLLSENYRVERIPINLTVDSLPSVRRVGDTTIIPVVEEIAVVKKQLVLREELRITRIRTELRRPQRIRLKRERVDVLTASLQESDIEKSCSSGVIPMAKTIVGLFDNQQKAQRVIQELADAGYPRSDIHCITMNGAAMGTSDVAGSLMRAGVPTEEVRHYSSEVDSGKSVLVLKTSDADVKAAVAILERNGAKDLDQRGYATTAGFAGTETTRLAKAEVGSTTTAIPVVEEELKVGKRQVQGGSVRVSTRMTEQPIEQDVSLRQEHLEVERRPANRPATEQDLRAFKEGTIEMTAMAEEPVVSKEARVVEEIVVSKDSTQEMRKIRDTVHKTEVEVDDKTGQQVHRELGSDVAGQNIRPVAGENIRLVNDEPAYTYGRTLASDPRYRGKNWATIEPEAKREWTTHQKGAWEEFKDRVRYAWEKMTGE